MLLIFFSLGEKSNISGKLLFDYDSKANSMHPAAAFTRKAAIHSVLRLYESTLKQKERVQESWDKQLLATVDQRKDAILHSTTDVKYTGKAYYVSNSGNDVNDGLSEETSWSTLDKVNTVELQPGDAVFFERNGLWRGRLIGQNGVTYSAYGTGDKPKIYGSPENGAGAEKWSLLKGSKNIWVFYKDIPDCGSIVFNEGQSWAEKQLVYWDGKKYVYNNDKKTEYNFRELPNMFFYNEINLSGRSAPFYIYGESIKGKLYLRCDAGNPGEIYQSIEFLTSSNMMSIWALLKRETMLLTIYVLNMVEIAVFALP